MRYLAGLFWIALVAAMVWLMWSHTLLWFVITVISLLGIALTLRYSGETNRSVFRRGMGAQTAARAAALWTNWCRYRQHDGPHEPQQGGLPQD